MADNVIKACTVMPLPEELEIDAMVRAIEERPDNLPIVEPGAGGPPEPKELALMTRKLWKPGRVLRVRFMGGDPVVKEKVERYAKLWEEHANITFLFNDAEDAEIRIAFADDGSWSYLGTDALSIPRHQATMNYGWLTPTSEEREYERVVVHEFGHALGCIHEHQNPAGSIPWDEEKLLKYYKERVGWSEEQTRHNLLRRYEADQTQFSEFDRDSIMLYPIPNELTKGDFEVGWNTTLSANDKQYIGYIYPKEERETVELEVDGPEQSASISTAGEHDWYRFSVTKPGTFVIETTGSTDVYMNLYGPNSRTAQIAYNDDIAGSQNRNSRITKELERGLYYVRMRHYYSSRTGDYSISVKRTNGS